MKCFSSQPGSAELASGLKIKILSHLQDTNSTSLRKQMFQRQIQFQIKVIAEKWCQLCLELSQPCLRALRNSPFIHWEVATNCAWLQATKMLYCKEPQSPSQQSLNSANRTGQHSHQKTFQSPRGGNMGQKCCSSITSSWTDFSFCPHVLPAGFPSTAPCWTDPRLAVSRAQDQAC